jgi:arylsulfatase A-like enzyme
VSARPNIVFLLNDHQAHYRHGWDGGPEVRRPSFDRLAAGGVEFSRAYAACPLCGPARRTMLTGLFPHAHGEIKNDTNHPYDREVYLDALAAAGYRNYYYGKWHAGPGTAFDHHCEGFCYPSYNNPYTKSEFEAYLEQKGLPVPEIMIERSFWDDETIREGALYRQERAWCNEHASGIMTTPKETHEAFFLADLACGKLRELAASGDDGPWSVRVDFWGPHQPYFPTQEFADTYDAGEIPEYGSFRDDLNDKPDVYRTDYNKAISRDRKLIQPSPLPWSEWQKVLARCYAQITMMDEAAGRVLDAIDELGLAEDTLVIWTTDHGDALACHGGHFDKASYMPEEMLRVPFAMRLPGRIAPGQQLDALVSNLDVAPTILDAAGLAFSRDVHGRSLIPLSAGEATDRREDLMCETYGHGENIVGRIMLTGRFKYVATGGQTNELYDLDNDPFELANLVGDPAHAGTLADMRSRLAAWQEATGDDERVIA